MSDHIAFYLNICHRFIKAGHSVDEVTVINAMLLSLPRTATWEIVKQSLLYQGTNLTLEMVTTELVTVYEWMVQEDLAGGVKTLALVAKQGNSGSNKNSNKNQQKKKNSSGWRQAKPEDTCHTCGEKGHWSPACPKKPKKSTSGQNVNSAHLTVNKLQPVSDREVSKMFMATHSSTRCYSGLLLDCATTCHMFSSHEVFVNYESVNGQTISVGGDRKLPVKGCGVVTFCA
jgi:hypothetical protein